MATADKIFQGSLAAAEASRDTKIYSGFMSGLFEGVVRRHLFRQKIDGASEGSRSNRRGRAGAPVEVHSADPLRGEEGPGVMRGRVGISWPTR